MDDNHVQNVCRIGQGKKCCSFLIASGEGEGFACAKEDEHLAIFTEILRKRIAKTIKAQGDNCSGPPSFNPQ